VPGFIGLSRMERELSSIFGGKTVDLRTPEDLSRFFRDRVINESKVFYEAA
jgi:predicted nucleotidyltransferase